MKLATLILLCAQSAVLAQLPTVVLDADGDGLGNTFDRPFAMDVSADGVLLVADVDGDVFRVEADGSVQLVMDASGDGLGNVLQTPGAVVSGQGGCFFVAGTISDNVFRVDPSGTVTEVIDETGDGVQLLDGPVDLATDSLGNLYVLGRESRNVFVIDSSGTKTVFIDDASLMSVPWAMAIDSLDRLYVGMVGGSGIARKPLAGGPTEFLAANYDVLDIAMGLPVGTVVFVHDAGLGEVLQVSPDDVVSVVIPQDLDGAGFLCAGAVATDSVGSVYGAGSNCSFSEPEARVVHAKRAGGMTQPITPAGDGVVPMLTASDVSLGAINELYVSSHDYINGGGYVFRVEPMCAPLPVETVVRNGIGLNPPGFEEIAPATPGGIWETTVDLGILGGDLSVVAPAASPLSPGLATPFGEVLIQRPFFLDVSFGHHAIPIPDQCSLVGAQLTSQAASIQIGTGLRLFHNAIDFVVGTF